MLWNKLTVLLLNSVGAESEPPGWASCCLCVSWIYRRDKNLNLSWELPGVVDFCAVPCSNQETENYCIVNQHGHCAQHRPQSTGQLIRKDNTFLEPTDALALMAHAITLFEHISLPLLIGKFCQHDFHNLPLWTSCSTMRPLLSRCIWVRVHRFDHMTT